ncbi:MAG: hypothetical protein R2788_22860 [Saprospiraceae bacterium]
MATFQVVIGWISTLQKTNDLHLTGPSQQLIFYASKGAKQQTNKQMFADKFLMDLKANKNPIKPNILQRRPCLTTRKMRGRTEKAFSLG